LCIPFFLDAKEWKLDSVNFTFEDDLFYTTDEEYSYGSRLLFLYEKDTDSYISFSIAQQMYTPENLTATELITDERPYAGYIYFESALYEVKKNHLNTFVFQVGLVGDATRVDRVQKYFHDITDSEDPQGWSNQLSNELTVQLNYNHKIYYEIGSAFDMEHVVIPEFGFNLGSASTTMFLGTLYRFGWGVAKNFGAATISNSSYSQISLDKKSMQKDFGFWFNLGLRANAIAKDIFLDGNRNVESHSVEKKNFTMDGVYGLSIYFKKFTFDWIHNYKTKEYTTQKKEHKYTSFQVGYHF
jgi:hypothetical protein